MTCSCGKNVSKQDLAFFVFRWFLLVIYLLVLGEEVRDLAGIEHVVEVFEHGLHDDLGVGE